MSQKINLQNITCVNLGRKLIFLTQLSELRKARFLPCWTKVWTRPRLPTPILLRMELKFK